MVVGKSVSLFILPISLSLSDFQAQLYIPCCGPVAGLQRDINILGISPFLSLGVFARRPMACLQKCV